MSAKGTDLARIQEVYDVIAETRRQIKAIGFDKERFTHPSNDQEDLMAEGILNRVLRVTEEAGRITPEVAEAYGFELYGVSGVRNRLAHAYGEVDRDIIWSVIERDFVDLLKACVRYCDDNGVSLA